MTSIQVEEVDWDLEPTSWLINAHRQYLDTVLLHATGGVPHINAESTALSVIQACRIADVLKKRGWKYNDIQETWRHQ